MPVQFLVDSVPAGFDLSSIFTMITDGVKSVIGLVSTFPLNIFLGASIMGIGVGIYKGLKR